MSWEFTLTFELIITPLYNDHHISIIIYTLQPECLFDPIDTHLPLHFNLFNPTNNESLQRFLELTHWLEFLSFTRSILWTLVD